MPGETDVADFEPGVSAFGRAAAPLAALVAAGALAGSPYGVVLALTGTLLVVAATRRASRRLLGIGFAGLIAGALLAGAYGTAPEPLLVSVVAALVAYDIGETALSVGEQLGRRARTRRLEVARAATGVGLFAVAGAVAYGAYRLSTGTPSAASVTLLLVGALLVAATLR